MGKCLSGFPPLVFAPELGVPLKVLQFSIIPKNALRLPYLLRRSSHFDLRKQE